MTAKRKAKSKKKRLYKAPKIKRAKHDFYVEEAFAADLLFAHERFKGPIADPACGSGTIPQAAKRAGYDQVIATDKVDRGYQFSDGVVDFLQPNVIYTATKIGSIVCNLPYKRGEILDWIRRCREIAFDKVALLLPLPFLASEGRHLFYKSWPPVRVLVLSSRPSCAPGDLLLQGKVIQDGGTEDYAWFIWSKTERPRVRGCTVVDWLIKPEALEEEKRRAARRAAKAAKARAA